MHFNILPLLHFLSVILWFTVSKHELQGWSYFCCNPKVKPLIYITNHIIITKLDLTLSLNEYRSNDPPWKARWKLFHSKGRTSPQQKKKTTPAGQQPKQPSSTACNISCKISKQKKVVLFWDKQRRNSKCPKPVTCYPLQTICCSTSLNLLPI